ncbi:MAG: glycosyltransferase family 4 protein [Proteobacteria bacterium]|nr:glycosyltransferase family 4 protein [Pseudomonadota bacterium]
MTTVGILTLSAMDHDSRVKKEIQSLRDMRLNIMAVSVGSREKESGFHSFSHPARRFLMPGISGLVLHCRFIICVIRNLFGVDIIHCNDLNTLPAGALLKILSLGRIKVVYDAHEFESNQIPHQSWWSIRTLRFLESVLIRFADAVITVSDGIAREYAKLYAIEKPALVMNCPPYQDIEKKDRFRERFGICADASIFLYQGGVSAGRGIERMLDAFSVLNDPKHVLVVMGYGPLVGLVEIYATKNCNIHYHPAVAPEGLLEYTASADCGLCLIEDSCFSYRYCSPNKLFEYIMAGLPVLVSNIEGLKSIVNDTGVGGVVDDESIDGLVKSIKDFKNKDSQSFLTNVRLASKTYCWEVQDKTLHAVYQRVLAKS